MIPVVCKGMQVLNRLPPSEPGFKNSTRELIGDRQFQKASGIIPMPWWAPPRKQKIPEAVKDIWQKAREDAQQTLRTATGPRGGELPLRLILHWDPLGGFGCFHS